MEGFLSIESLTKKKAALVTLPDGARIREALQIMKNADYSQVPLVSKGRAVGLVTLERIAHATTDYPLGDGFLARSVDDFLDPIRMADVSEDLFRWFDFLAEHNAIVVLKQGKVHQIVTNYDVLKLFQAIAEDFIWIREVETSLRSLVSSTLGNRLTQSLHLVSQQRDDPGRVQSLEELYTGELLFIIYDSRFAPEFSDFSKRIPQGEILSLLELRNQVCHFRGPLTPGEKSALKAIRDRVKGAI